MSAGRDSRANFDDGMDPTEAQPGSPQPAPDEDPRLLAVVREYLAVLESGGHPRRQEWLERYPEIAAELAVYLDGLSFVHSAAAQVLGGGNTHPPPIGRGVDAETEAGRPLGDFRLLREIGRGGMGVVYEAEQLSLGRRVAVKVLPLASSLDSRQLQRFRHEAQAAAQLHHTNIVPVYAVGCERSVHFYAMQLIEGRSLADVISTLRATTGRGEEGRRPGGGPSDETVVFGVTLPHAAPSRSYEVPRSADASRAATSTAASAEAVASLHGSRGGEYFRAVARLGLQAADALDYAHAVGVVHRDIKPANLLLDPRGTLWITDFGLAQMYTDVTVTQPGDLVGTLRYMSPEQASGRAVVLDQRTDIYSLGVTLYELLSLERALPGRTREELLYEISSVDPAPLRTVNKAVPRELETIVAKAIAKEPADRYATAGALAEDLQRFLRDEPILARPPSVWNKAVKWTRRHRALSLSAVVVLLMAAVGLLVSTLLIAREQAKTQDAYLREREQHGLAEKSFTQARAQVDFLARVAAEELADDPQAAEVRKEMLEAALDYYQEFLEDHRGDKTVGGELAEAQAHVSAILSELSAFESFARVQSQVRLLTEPSVRGELRLSDEQASKAQDLSWDFPGRFRAGGPREENRGLRDENRNPRDEIRNPREEGRGPDGDGPDRGRDAHAPREPDDGPRHKSFVALATETESALGAMLTSPQLTRLREISRQERGPASFGDPDAAAVLGLSLSQRDVVRRAQADFRKSVREAFRRAGPWGRGDDLGGGPDSAVAARDEAVRQILAHLTPAQVAAWRSLTGQLFTGKISFRRPHGPGGDGPPKVPGRDRTPGIPLDRRGPWPGAPSNNPSPQ